jgi:serine/threonine-protein kinase
MIGKTLVHYEITSQIGKGGMGEVYQAKDTKLGRDVAIKVLPEEFAMDHDRVARFQREAKLLASLNHPNIAAIYGLEESDDTHFLVMELIEGDTLRDRIKSGPIPVEEALKLALQMAEALEAAHEKGVIHRDLKPANIKVTPDGKVKILDFGLAKAYVGDQSNINLADSPTISAAATQKGVILGTAAYMSPEQARGKLVDKRADIWAFGVVLFEMLTGKNLFSGEDVTSTVARVLEREPDFLTLPKNLHPRIQLMLERCLKKDPKDRYSGISDARVDIQSVLADPSGIFVQPVSTAGPRRNIRSTLSLIAAVVVLTAIIVGVAIWILKPAPPSEPRRVTRFSYELPEGQQFPSDIMLAVSPDGRQFVYCTTDGLYLRSVDALDARRILGTDRNSREPVFSPDGQWIAYWSQIEQKLKKIAISGGVPVVLCDTSITFGGLSWSSDNTIVYGDALGGGVKRISSDGGTPEILIEANLTKMSTEGIPVAPQMLPDGKNILFGNLFSLTDLSNSQITIQSLESGERKVLGGGITALYLSTGHLLSWQANDNLMSIVAVPFDPNTLEVKGGPTPLLEGLMGSAVSDSGTLVYVSERPSAPGSRGDTGTSRSQEPGRRMVWVDFEGKESPIRMPPRDFQYPKISPDGTRVALTVSGNNADIWIWNLERETLTPLTFDGAVDLAPIWSPDSKRIAFFSLRESVGLKETQWGGVFCKSADGTGELELLCQGSEGLIFPMCWSGDGNTLMITQWVGSDMGNQDIAMLSMNEDHTLKPLLNDNYLEVQPQLSPDGRWLAYCTGRGSGQPEIYVRPFPEVNSGLWQVSTNGGNSPLWSPDGREIFYLIRNAEGVMAVAVETEPTFKPGKPRLLFSGSYVGWFPANNFPWDIHPDGERFLMMKEAGTTGNDSSAEESEPAGPRKITIVLNWDEELKERVTVD